MKYTHWITKAAFAFAACVLFTASLYAQLPVIPGVTVLPPQLNSPSAFLSDWQSRASTATVTVTNATNTTFSAKIWVEFKLNGEIVAFTQPAKLPFTSIHPGANQFNGETLAPISTVHFNNNVDQSSQRAGRVPDGQICLIVHVLDPQKNLESVSPPETGCSFILSFSPPVLILPGDGSELCKLGTNNVEYKRDGAPMPMFQWTPVVPAPPAPTQVIYHFAIFEVLPGQSPIAAFRGARPLFTQDVQNQLNLFWPTQYFLPEKGKMYTWSVQALDQNRNPFVLQNNGWATPFTFTVGSDCDVNGISGILILPTVLDFGSHHINSGPVTQQITLQNIGNEPVALQLPTLTNGAQFGFSLGSPPSTPIIAPATSATFDVTFNPTHVGSADGSVRISSDAGTAQVQLKGKGVDAASPTITVTSPPGGEVLSADSQYKIQFSASDNDLLSDFIVHLSTDGGTSFTTTIIPADNSIVKPPVVLWNIPSDLRTMQGIIKVSATDKSGNPVSGFSGIFSIGNGGGETGDNTSPDIKTKNTNMTDIYVMRRDQTSFTFVPLAFEILSPNGSPHGIRPGSLVNPPSGVAPNSPGETQKKVKLEIPSDLLDNNGSANSGGGILISSESGGGLNGSTMRYCVQYHETDFHILTPGKGTASSKDANGAPLNSSVIYPEDASFVDGESFLHQPVPPPPDPNGSAGKLGSLNTRIKISPIDGEKGETPLTAYFNPKEISIDKSVPWQHSHHGEGDAPGLEYTAGEPAALNVELLFDMFEEKKSVKPDLQHFLRLLGINDATDAGKYGRIKVKFYWDREGKKGGELSDLSIKYTMFLPDGTPCRATAHLRMSMPDSIPPRTEGASADAHSMEDPSMFFSTDLGPQTLQYLQGNQFGADPILHDPVFADQERALRSALIKNLPLVSNANVTFSRDKLKGLTGTMGDFHQGSHFTVEIDGTVVGGIHSIDGLPNEADIVPYKDGEDGTMHTRRKTGKLSLSKDWSNTPEWYNWNKSASSGKTDRRSISVIFHNDAGEEAGRMNFYDCFPTRYEEPQENAKNSGHASEKIEIAYGEVDLLPAVQRFSGDFKTMAGSMSQAGQQMTMLIPTIIGGQKTDMILIGLLLPPLSVVPGSVNTNDRTDVNGDLTGWKWNALVPNAQEDPGSPGTGNTDVNGDGRSYTAGNFQLDIDGIPAGEIQNADGGVIGDVQGGKPVPGPIALDIIPTSSAVYDWIKASFDMSYVRKSGAINAADFNRDIRQVREFKDALITEVSFPACDGASKDAAYMNIKFEPEKIINKTGSGKIEAPVDVKQKLYFPANFRMTIDGIDCSKVNKIDGLTIKQSTVKDDIGEKRDYQKEPGKIDFPNLKVIVSEEYAHDFWAWHEDYVIKGNNDDSKHKNGSLIYLDPTRSKELLRLDFDCVGIFKGTPEASENNSDKIRRIKYVIHIKNIKVH